MNIVATVVKTIALLALTALVGIVALAVLERPIPDVLQNIAIGSLTAIAGILAKTGVEKVEVVNTEDRPVPVAEEDVPLPAKKAAGTRKAANAR